MPGHIFPKPEAGPVSLYYWDGSAWQKWLGNPLTTGSQLYYWDGAAWQKWPGNPTSIESQGYVWDGAAWQKMAGDAAGHVQVDVKSLPYSVLVEQSDPTLLRSAISAWDGLTPKKVLAWPSGALAHRRTPPACTTAAVMGRTSICSVPAILYWATISNYGAALQSLEIRDGGSAGILKWMAAAQGITQVHCVFDPPIHFGTNIYFNSTASVECEASCGYDID